MQTSGVPASRQRLGRRALATIVRSYCSLPSLDPDRILWHTGFKSVCNLEVGNPLCRVRRDACVGLVLPNLFCGFAFLLPPPSTSTTTNPIRRYPLPMWPSVIHMSALQRFTQHWEESCILRSTMQHWRYASSPARLIKSAERETRRGQSVVWYSVRSKYISLAKDGEDPLCRVRIKKKDEK